MAHLKNILFPTDFTDDAAKAYDYALEVALKTGAELHLLHVIEEPFDFATRVEDTVDVLKSEAKEHFDNYLAELKGNEAYNQIKIECHIERGKPVRVITEIAEEVDANVIIMGTKGESSLKRILYGNVTSNVILESQIPIITVPINSKKPYLDRFLFATDFRSKDLEALASTIRLARAFDAEVHIVHVSDNEGMDDDIRFRGFKDLVAEKFDYDKIEFHHLQAERFSKGVSEFLSNFKISLIVITRYKKVFLRTLLWANNSQELTYHTTVPMLVLIPETLENIDN